MGRDYTVDRIEGDLAVLVADDLSTCDVALADLPGGTREGSCLTLEDGVWSLNEALLVERAARIRDKMRDLFKH